MSCLVPQAVLRLAVAKGCMSTEPKVTKSKLLDDVKIKKILNSLLGIVL